MSIGFYYNFGVIIFLRNRRMEISYKKQLHAFINNLVNINKADWEIFNKHLHFKEYDKNEVLQRAGETENYMYFLVEGVTRIFHINDNIEYTLRFNFPISAFNSYASFISRTPSLVNVEAISNVKVFRISHYDLQNLYEISKTAERVGRRMIEYLYVLREIKEIQMHSKTAEDYYFELIRNNKQLTEQISQKHLASYLGITPESLSRIKNKNKH